MNMRPLVSIVIPVYNGSNYMREAIDSALTQTYKNIEIIVVNDGSTDNTRDIALSYGEKIRYFEKENGGAATALNLGIREMRGEFFSWLSHDDLYDKRKIEASIQAMGNYGNPDMPVFCDYCWMQMPTKKIRPHKFQGMYGKSGVKSGLGVLLCGGIVGCELLIPRSFFDKYGLFDESFRAAHDTHKWYQMFTGAFLIHIAEPLVVYREHTERVTNKCTQCVKNDAIRLYRYRLNLKYDIGILNMGWTLYQLYGWMLSLLLAEGDDAYPPEIYYDIYSKFISEDEPSDYEHKLKSMLHAYGENPIYLYCAGTWGRRLLMHLTLCAINVAGFSDSNSDLWWKKIGEGQCIPPYVLPKNSLIIVTKVDPYELRDSLLEQGWTNVITYDEIFDLVMETPIDKKRLIRYMEKHFGL